MKREFWELKWAADAWAKNKIILFDTDVRLVEAINDVLEIAGSPQDVFCEPVRRARAEPTCPK